MVLEYLTKPVTLEHIYVNCAGAEDYLDFKVELGINVDLESDEVWIETAHHEGLPLSPLEALFGHAEEWVLNNSDDLLDEAKQARVDAKGDT